GGSVVATTAHVAEAASPPNDRSPLQWQGRVQIADLPLTLDFGSTAAYAAHPRLFPIYLLFAAGLAASLFGAGAVLQLTRRRLRLQALTRELLVEVAERRYSEQRLKESETRYRVLIENNPDAILLHRDGHVTFANSACARIFGVATPDMLLGRSVF